MATRSHKHKQQKGNEQKGNERPSSFFQEFLPGEQPLSFETASELCSLAETFIELAPWTVFTETAAQRNVRPVGSRPGFDEAKNSEP